MQNHLPTPPLSPQIGMRHSEASKPWQIDRVETLFIAITLRMQGGPALAETHQRVSPFFRSNTAWTTTYSRTVALATQYVDFLDPSQLAAQLRPQMSIGSCWPCYITENAQADAERLRCQSALKIDPLIGAQN
jgi:hypothetical protein